MITKKLHTLKRLFIAMKNIFFTLLISCILFSCSIHGMELIATASPSPNQKQENMQKPLWLPQEIIAHIAGYCQPTEKDVLMKLCKDFYACLHNKELILLANPLTVTLSHKRKKMFEYTRSGDVKKLSIWLSTLSAEDINGKENPYRWASETPLHIATSNNDTNSMRLLIKYGANVDQKDRYGSPCLVEASGKGHIEAVQLLLTHGANVNQADDSEQTPLYVASHEGYLKIVKLLLAHKANIHAKITGNFDGLDRIFFLELGDTALDIAKKKGHTQIVELLEAKLLKETEK